MALDSFTTEIVQQLQLLAKSQRVVCLVALDSIAKVCSLD